MGILGAIGAGATVAGMGTKMAGAIMGAKSASEKAAFEMAAAETSKILEAAFFDEEVGGIIAESARLVGASEAEAGVRGVKSTTGTAAARTAEIRSAGRRELRTAAQETVLTRHGFAQAGRRAERAGRAARIQGGLGAAGAGFSGVASLVSGAATGKFGKKASDWVGSL